MEKVASPIREGKVVLNRNDFDRLFVALHHCDCHIVGPALRDGAVVYNQLKSASDLPAGWTDEQSGGSYRLKRRRKAGPAFGDYLLPKWKTNPVVSRKLF